MGNIAKAILPLAIIVFGLLIVAKNGGLIGKPSTDNKGKDLDNIQAVISGLGEDIEPALHTDIEGYHKACADGTVGDWVFQNHPHKERMTDNLTREFRELCSSFRYAERIRQGLAPIVFGIEFERALESGGPVDVDLLALKSGLDPSVPAAQSLIHQKKAL